MAHDSWDKAKILTGYLVCAAWASTQTGKHRDGRVVQDKPIEDFEAHWTARAKKSALQDIESFLHLCSAEDLEAYRINRRLSDGASIEEHLGHDIFLTQNHHGTGFWDRGLPNEIGERLSKHAHSLGSASPYVHKGRIDWM